MLTYATEKVKVQLVIVPLLSHDCLNGGYDRTSGLPSIPTMHISHWGCFTPLVMMSASCNVVGTFFRIRCPFLMAS